MKASDDAKLIMAALLTLASVIEASGEQGTTRELRREQGLSKINDTFRKIFAQQKDQ